MPADDHKIGDEGRRAHQATSSSSCGWRHPGQVAWDSGGAGRLHLPLPPRPDPGACRGHRRLRGCTGPNSVGSGGRDVRPDPGSAGALHPDRSRRGPVGRRHPRPPRRRSRVRPGSRQVGPLIHVTPAKCCPATEPEVVPGDRAVAAGERADKTEVMASAWSSWTPAGTRPQQTQRPHALARGRHRRRGDVDPGDIHPYAGHGTFIAGVIRCSRSDRPTSSSRVSPSTACPRGIPPTVSAAAECSSPRSSHS